MLFNLTCEKCNNKTDELYNGFDGSLMCRDCYEEEEIPCNHCGCYEQRCDMTDGVCDDCYEDYLEDLELDEDED